MDNQLIFRMALTMAPGIGDVHSKMLLQVYGDAEAIFKAPLKQLEKLEGIGTVKARNIKNFTLFDECEKEILFLDKYQIQPVFITDGQYPKRLLNCYDSPPMLYYRGNANLNAERIVSIVGTRNHSEYGRRTCEKLVEELKDQNVLIVSGLASGIDTIAHKSSLKQGIPTIGVLAHGLDRIYPPENKSLAKEMILNGGLLTDFRSGVKPNRQNFPSRNRIVAGICDALIVVESQQKGGSLITAELANSYNKDVFAIPGRVTDMRSEGCNFLVKTNKASMITGAADLLHIMNWSIRSKPVIRQRALFIDLSENEQRIADLLGDGSSVHVDELFSKSGLSTGNVAEALLMLEMQGILRSLPGKLYQLL